VFKAHRRVYHSTLGSRVIKNKKVAPGERDALSAGLERHQDHLPHVSVLTA